MVGVLVPPPLVGLVRMRYRGSRIQLGAQDVSLYPPGAHTGESSAELLASSGASHVLVGHAERRADGETDENISLKVRRALDVGLTPVLCFGEQTRDREGQHFAFLEATITAGLKMVRAAEAHKVILAYEPVWAIGAQQPPDAREVYEAVVFARKTLAVMYGREQALKARILYGGAVSKDTALQLIERGAPNGFLVGRASLNPDEFASIIRVCQS